MDEEQQEYVLKSQNLERDQEFVRQLGSQTLLKPTRRAPGNGASCGADKQKSAPHMVMSLSYQSTIC